MLAFDGKLWDFMEIPEMLAFDGRVPSQPLTQ